MNHTFVHYLFSIIALTSFDFVLGQENETSLIFSEEERFEINKFEDIINNAESRDTSKLAAYVGLSEVLYLENFDTLLSLSLIAEDLAISKIKNADNLETKRALNYYLAFSYNNQGYFWDLSGDIEKAIPLYKKGLELRREIDDQVGIAASLNNLGYACRLISDYPTAMKYYLQSLTVFEKTGDISGKADVLNNISLIYGDLEDYDLAIKYGQQSLDIQIETEDYEGMSLAYNNLGSFHDDLNQEEAALEYYTLSLEMEKKLNNPEGIAYAYNNIGTYYSENENYSKALTFFERSSKILEKLGDEIGIAYCYANITSAQINMGLIDDALNNAKTSLKLSTQNGLNDNVRDVSHMFYRIYSIQKQPQLALDNFERYVEIKDAIINDENNREVREKHHRFEFQKKAVADSIKTAEADKVYSANIALEQAENKNKQLEIDSQNKQTWYLYLGLGLVGMFALFIFNRFKISQKQKTIIVQQKEDVETQQKELRITHNALEYANKELNDSINYAEMIQNAVLPTLGINDLLNEAFLYFNPKEKVSGDFYWLEQKEEYSGYCVADCTGHGIPGAFITMIGTILMNEIHNTKKINVPDKILNELTRLVQLTLTDRSGATMKDGMDLSFVLLNNDKKVIYFSGANNPIWIVSNQSKKNINRVLTEPVFELEGKYMYEVKGNKQPIGFYDHIEKPFDLHRIDLIESDIFYLFSDGYVDQFGGPKNKKFKAKPFRELLLKITNYPMLEQERLIADAFNSWKGNEEQVDDVTVIGVRV